MTVFVHSIFYSTDPKAHQIRRQLFVSQLTRMTTIAATRHYFKLCKMLAQLAIARVKKPFGNILQRLTGPVCHCTSYMRIQDSCLD